MTVQVLIIVQQTNLCALAEICCVMWTGEFTWECPCSGWLLSSAVCLQQTGVLLLNKTTPPPPINTVKFKGESVVLDLSLLALSPSRRRGVQFCQVALWNGSAEEVLRGVGLSPDPAVRGEFSAPWTGALAHWVGMGLAERCDSYCCHRMLILPLEP